MIYWLAASHKGVLNISQQLALIRRDETRTATNPASAHSGAQGHTFGSWTTAGHRATRLDRSSSSIVDVITFNDPYVSIASLDLHRS